MNPTFIQNLPQTSLIYGIFVFLAIWLVILTFLYWFALHHYRRLTKEVKGIDLKKILEEYLKWTGDNTAEIRELGQRLENLQKDGAQHLQRIGLVRFNPFEDMGGDQSFALAVLDEHGTGLVISSLHGRDMTRVYSKPVKSGKASGYEFSDEEKAAIAQALR